MILAAPLVIPFAEAIGLSVAVLGMAKIGDEVNKYIEKYPEESMKILSTIVPGVGIGEIFMSKEDSGDDDEEVEVEEDTRSKKEIVLGELGKEKGNYSDKDAEGNYASKRGRIIRALEDAGKVNPDREYNPEKKYKGYKRFLKKADGGAIGIEVLFEEKKPRQGLFMGGSPLEGQALAIYNSMNAYGFNDQAIANALESQGLYTPSGSSTPETTAPNIINQQLQTGGGRDDNQTGFGKFGNLDPTTEKTFTKDVYTIDKNAAPGAPMTGSFKPTEITGYKNVNTGLYQTLEGKNINHAGINIKPGLAYLFEAIGLGEPKNLTGLPYKEGQIAGTFTGKKLSDFNPFNLFQKQQATLADIQAMNKKAGDELRAKQEAERQAALQAKIQAEAAAGKSLSQIGREQFTGEGQAFQAGNIGKSTFTGGKTKSNVGGVPGGKYGSPRKDGGLMFAQGGLATMFTRRR